MSLWRASEAAAATGGTPQGDWVAQGVSIDTRSLEPGDLFVALKAARDGHEFVASALDRGAAAALVSHVPKDVAPDAPLLIVPDVLAALEALGRAARARTQARVLGVTGSVGKTSSKEMLRTVLSRQGRTHASVASYNNHWGVPLTLARMPADTQYAVIEIGMNHPGEIAPLARLARPDVALITTVTAAHLEAFDDIEGIAREKASIVEGLGETVILNADIDVLPVLEEVARARGVAIRTFGRAGTKARLVDLRLSGTTSVIEALFDDAQMLFKLMTPGAHFAMNALGVLAAVDALGADAGTAAVDLAHWSPPAGRGARSMIQLDRGDARRTVEMIDDAYNANPASLGAALDVLAAAEVVDGVGRIARGRRIAILGDMKELGANEAKLHREVAQHPAMERIDLVHTVGPLMRDTYAALPPEKRGECCDTAAEMAAQVARIVDAGDCVLIKGSLSVGLSAVVDAIRNLGHAAQSRDARNSRIGGDVDDKDV